MKPASFLAVLLSFGLLSIAVACTTTTTRIVAGSDAGSDSGKEGPSTVPSPKGDDDDTKGDDDDDTKKGDDDDDTTPPKKKTAATCKKSSTTQTECLQCCGEVEPSGFKTYNAGVSSCLCAEGVCKDQCKTTLCASTPKNPTQDCADCANAADIQQCLTDACSPDAKCVAYSQCLQDASCQTKAAQ